MLSLIYKQEVAILEAYQDSCEERRENLDRKLYGPLLPNASVNDSNYTWGPEQQSDYLRADNVEPTIPPPKKHGLSTNFLVENLLNACPTSQLAVARPSTGFSDSQEQIVHEQIQSDSDTEPELSDSLASDSNFELWSKDTGKVPGKTVMANKTMPLFKCFKKNLDIASFPGVVTRLSEMKEFFQSDLNSKRRQLKISDMTWSKTLE